MENLARYELNCRSSIPCELQWNVHGQHGYSIFSSSRAKYAKVCVEKSRRKVPLEYCPPEGLARIELNRVERYTFRHLLYLSKMRPYLIWNP
jgi:hypothetical protein